MEKDQGELLKTITSFLEKNEIPYIITGAWSAIYYSRPRASYDIDFVVEVVQKDIERILLAFTRLSEDFLVQAEDIKEAIIKKGMFNILHLPTMLKLDFWLLQDHPFDRSRFARKQEVKILNQFMWLASAEDTILQKLKWYKKGKIEKHLIDAAFVYQIQKKNLDQEYLRAWAEKLGVLDYFKELGKINLEEYI